MNTLDISAIFKSDADDIIKLRADAVRIHATDIRAAGDQVETSVRDYLHRMLPPKYYVSHGHLLDRFGKASSQLDVIVSDNVNLPSLMTTKDGTEYIPIDSVYSVGEIKSAYYKSKNPIKVFSKTIKDIKKNLYHPEIINTACEGVKEDTLIRDIVIEKGNRVLNSILFFAIFVDGRDFNFEDVSSFYTNNDIKYLPNFVVIMNKGIILRGFLREKDFVFNRYPEDPKDENEDWYFCPFPGTGDGSLEGNHLGVLYYSLVEHLANSFLEPPSLKNYLTKLMKVHKSLLKRARDT